MSHLSLTVQKIQYRRSDISICSCKIELAWFANNDDVWSNTKDKGRTCFPESLDEENEINYVVFDEVSVSFLLERERTSHYAIGSIKSRKDI